MNVKTFRAAVPVGKVSPRPDPWSAATWLAGILVLGPIAAIAASAFQPATDVLKHIVQTELHRITFNTAVLGSGVAFITALLGISLAWLTTMCDLPGRRFFSWALLLPLAIPTYVLAFTYLGIFDFSGPIAVLSRKWSLPMIPDIRSPVGVICVISLALYPYVYFITRNAFLTQGTRGMEAARSLGRSPWGGFFQVSLPMARPWIIGGVLLVLMEVLADFGAVSVFNYDTYTTAIYKAWFGLFSLPAAAQLSGILVLFSFALLTAENRARTRMRFSQMGNPDRPNLITMGPAARWTAFLFATGVLTVAFLVPVTQLVWWAVAEVNWEPGVGTGQAFDPRYIGYLGRTLFLGILAAFVICCLATASAFAVRRHPRGTVPFMARLSTMGYALPGTILAVGVFIPTALADRVIGNLVHRITGLEGSLYLQGTLLVMIAAYAVRFMAVGFHPIESSVHRIKPSITDTARIMGLKGFSIFRRVYVPLVKSGILTGLILVIVDVMKEMPITLMTRPFGFDTLAVKIFEFTSEGEWERAAIPALTLVLTGLLPVVFLTRMSSDAGTNKGKNTGKDIEQGDIQPGQ
jgi:iron(III) transport system permease protein